MIGFVKSKINYQERLSHDDIRLLIDVLQTSDIWPNITETRLQLLIGKLKRMGKQ